LAANIIRQKLATIYADEPSATKEIQEAEAAKPRSKHQRFMHELASSGKNMAEVQTAWHNYYVGLPDDEKHEVWQEFYETNSRTSHYQQYVASQQTETKPPLARKSSNQPVIVNHQSDIPLQTPNLRSASAIKKQLLGQVNQRSQLQAKHHLKSLGFGLAMGSLVLIIFLFGFFNQVIITPFIQPSRHVSSMPLIVDSSSISASTTPEVIIPKINVEIPVDYSQTSDDENAIEGALENGVVHYPSTVLPGQNGNAAFFGHSSNNIFNPGKYKFAFVLLHELVKGDTFYLTYGGRVYVYQVIDRKIVPPTDVAVLNDTEGKAATATLITCDPPGTSINRLVVTGEQISPSPSGNTNPTTTTSATTSPVNLPGNGPSLWSRFWNWLFN
jgi:sortase A